MKIIEELKIGSYERYKSYFETGSPEVFISKKTGFCRYCETKFEFDEGRYYVNNYPVYSRMFCPICGHISLDSEIRYSSVEGKYLPYVVNLKILEMKSKVILKIEYRAIQIIGKLLEIKIFDVIEMYIFDIQNNNVIWKRYINKKLNDDLEIGYIIDYQKLMENTALWYFNIKHIVRKGTTLSQFLKRLRELVIKKEKNIKSSMKNLKYFSGNTALSTYEFHSYLIELGLDPILIQTSDIPSEDDPHLKIILEKADPFVTRAANIGPLKYLYSVLKPNISIGAGNSSEMRKYGVVPVILTNAYNILGFEVNTMVLETISKANKDSKHLKGGNINELM